MLKRISLLMSTACLALTLGGCAHPISMAPDLAAIESPSNSPVSNKKVGYHISDASRALEITTPGGGGDKVRYFPYRDLEPGLYKALGTVFSDVTKILDPSNDAATRQSGISLLVTPEISTTSSSDSFATWPPTRFTVALNCQLKDVDGKIFDTIRVEGEGQAEFSEFKSNFSLSAVRASNDALQKLVIALRQSLALEK